MSPATALFANTITASLPQIQPRRKHSSTVVHHPPPTEYLATLIDGSKSIIRLRQIHAFLYRHGFHDHPALRFKLLRSYSSQGQLNHALAIFYQSENPDVNLYSSIIHALRLQSFHHEAFVLYSRMLTENVRPSAFTLSSILKCCNMETGRLIHSQAIKFRLDSALYVSTCLVDVYAKGGDVLSARKLFDATPEKSLVCLTTMITCYAKYGMIKEAKELFDGLDQRDTVCWTVMINGYLQQGQFKEGLMLFRQMLKAKVRPDEATMVVVLSACAQLGDLESGKWVHSYIENNDGIKINVCVGTALVNMYSKCGSLEDARLVFDRIPSKDVVAWNAMIVAYAMHGFGQDAWRLFHEMCGFGYRPTDVTFIGILSACAHAGLVSEGWEIFHSMKQEYGIEPKVEHYGCMVNLLGRCGHLEEAYELVKNMEIERDPILWGALLWACRLHGNTTLGEKIADFLVNQNLAHSGTYILLANMYAASENWQGVAKVRTLMRDSRVVKESGVSSIEVNSELHEFLAGDMRHPKSKEIHMMLEEMYGWLEAYGYAPQTDIVLHDLADAQKEKSLRFHSEKLALAFGLISSKPGTTIKIMKNLRICTDCHAVTKLISEITGRKIIMRDRSRFHHFENGSCSCGDYW